MIWFVNGNGLLVSCVLEDCKVLIEADGVLLGLCEMVLVYVP
jgi:hypothetical protein